MGWLNRIIAPTRVTPGSIEIIAPTRVTPARNFDDGAAQRINKQNAVENYLHMR